VATTDSGDVRSWHQESAQFGIGRPPGRRSADYVLSDFSAAERKELEFLVDRSADIVESLVSRGLEWTQNAYHAAS
jgi:PTH1 family peptidyl-tRNA hydrolase